MFETIFSKRCGWIRRRLSTYLDGELSKGVKEALERHLDKCKGCQAEFEAMKGQKASLLEIKSIEPSAGLYERFRVKVSELNEKERALEIPKAPIPILRWVPVPLAFAAIIVLFLSFSTVSPLLFAGTGDLAKKMSCLLQETFLAQKPGVLPVQTLSEFCDKYCETLCAHIMESGGDHKCICGHCKHK